MNELVEKNALKLSTQRLMVTAFVRLFFGLFAVFVFGVVQGLRLGFRERDYLFLMFGSAASYFLAFAYGCVGIARANGRGKQTWMFYAIWSGILPYLFLMYLIFYRGGWALVRLFSAFSWSDLSAAFVFIVIGLFTIRHLQTITDVVRIVREIIEA